jgi:WXG100 family type VII secretion target
MRIIVDPDRLQMLARQMQDAAHTLNQVHSRINSALGQLDWEARSRAGVDGQVNQACSQARNLANRADEMARFLERKARMFAEADGQSITGSGQSIQDIIQDLYKQTPMFVLPRDDIQRWWSPAMLGQSLSIPIATLGGMSGFQLLKKDYKLSKEILGTRDTVRDLLKLRRNIDKIPDSMINFRYPSGHISKVAVAQGRQSLNDSFIPQSALGKSLAVVDIALEGYDNWQDYSNDGTDPDLIIEKTVVATTMDAVAGVTFAAVGTALGTAGGAALGGALAGPVGAVVGAKVGGIVGGMAGGWAASQLSESKVYQEAVDFWGDQLDKGVDKASEIISDNVENVKHTTQQVVGTINTIQEQTRKVEQGIKSFADKISQPFKPRLLFGGG